MKLEKLAGSNDVALNNSSHIGMKANGSTFIGLIRKAEMIMQSELLLSPGKKEKPDPRVKSMIRVLQLRKGWIHRNEFKYRFGWSERTCRKLVEESKGRIQSGQLGYILTIHNSLEGFSKSNSRIQNQGKKMLERAFRERKIYYKRKGNQI